MSVQPSTRRFPQREIVDLARLGEVRAAFTAWLVSAGVDAERIDDQSVVVSELGANAVTGTPTGSPAPTVAARLEGRALLLEVRNHVGDDGADAWDLEDPLRTGGRGLLLVSAFCDEVEVDVEGGDVLVVRCRTEV